MVQLEKAAYPPQKPEILSNLGFSLTPFTTCGVSGYTLHRTGHPPVLHSKDAVKGLPQTVKPVRASLSSTKATLFELDRFVERMRGASNDQLLLAKLGLYGLLTNPQDLLEVCDGYENKQQQLREDFAQYVAQSQAKIAQLEAKIMKVPLPLPPPPPAQTLRTHHAQLCE